MLSLWTWPCLGLRSCQLCSELHLLLHAVPEAGPGVALSGRALLSCGLGGLGLGPPPGPLPTVLFQLNVEIERDSSACIWRHQDGEQGESLVPPDTGGSLFLSLSLRRHQAFALDTVANLKHP